MLGLLTKKKKDLKVLYNVNIKLTEFLNVKNLHDFYVLSNLVDRVKDLEGSFYVLETGELIRGKKDGLHTFSGELDVCDVGRLPHVHYKEKPFNYVLRDNGKPFFEEVKEVFEISKEVDLEQRNPVYTLEGLYNTLEDNRGQTRLNALVDVLKKQAKYDFNSIATNERIKIFLLENAYKRKISDQ